MTTLVENKKARFNYEILETLEAGLMLSGTEVKSLRKKQASLDGSHVIVRGNEAFLVGATIPPYQAANTSKDYDPARIRKLLLNKKELSSLVGYEKQKGLTIVPISVYTKGRRIKLQIAIVRGKKKYDKRESIKKKDTERDMKRTLKRNISL